MGNNLTYTHRSGSQLCRRKKLRKGTAQGTAEEKGFRVYKTQETL